MAAPDIAQRVRNFLDESTAPDDRLLLAVSGGADSMGMLALLADSLQIPASRLSVGHIDHMIRADTDLDLKLVDEFTKSRGIRLATAKVNAPETARQEHRSLEAVARDLRYAALEQMAGKLYCRWILTAHTMDDSAETVLMRMRTGAPWYEWTGIPAMRGNILRPLLQVMRHELWVWTVQHQVPFREDETNLSLRFQRNRLRTVLRRQPELWSDTVIHRFHSKGHDLDAGLAQCRKLIYVFPRVINARLGEGRIGLAIDEIFCYFNNLTFLPIEAMWARLNHLPPDARLPSKVRIQIAQFLHGSTPDATLELPSDVNLVRRGKMAWLIKGKVQPVCMRVGPGVWPVPERNGFLMVGDELRNPERCRAAMRVSKDILSRNLTLRSPRPGDRLRSAGRPAKKVADIFSEERRDPVERARALLLCDEDGPFWLLGGALDARAAADEAQGDGIWISWNEGEASGAGNDL